MDKILSPQQELFLSYYTNPKSETFSNACQSALKAGYAQEYAENITSLMPDWLSESIGDMKRLKKAEKNLDEVQNLPIISEDGKVDVGLVDKRTKVDMFIAERLGKNKYSIRNELTGKDGELLQVIIPQSVAKAFNINESNQETGGSNTQQEQV